MGAPARIFTDLELRRMQQMVADGIGHAAIASRFYTSLEGVARVIRQQGWVKPRLLWSRNKAMAGPLPDLHSNTRRVAFTHDGKPIGWTEPLDREKPAKPRFVFFG